MHAVYFWFILYAVYFWSILYTVYFWSILYAVYFWSILYAVYFWPTKPRGLFLYEVCFWSIQYAVGPVLNNDLQTQHTFQNFLRRKKMFKKMLDIFSKNLERFIAKMPLSANLKKIAFFLTKLFYNFLTFKKNRPKIV